MNIRIFAMAFVVGLAGCGAETLGTAATGASIKKQELAQGQKTLEQSKQKLEQALQAQQPRQSAE